MDTPTPYSQSYVENTGSNARDFCMLERNILSHMRLAFLLSLLSSSVLLRVRLAPSDEEGHSDGEFASKAGIPLACIHFLASLAVIVAGCWEYRSGYIALRNMRAFLFARKSYLTIMSAVAGVIVSTYIILLPDKHQL